MDFDLTPRQRETRDRVKAFMEEHIIPAIPDYEAEMNVSGAERWKVIQTVERLKEKARAAGLWNMFMPPHSGQVHVDDSFEFQGLQLTNLEYSLIAEELGKVGFASEVFNCSAPDTGNMEVLMRYGTLEQKERWLRPLMNGEIRSAFLMTEPAVASSDATNIETRIERDGDHYVINGRKWWSSGVGDPRCKVAIVMGKTNPGAPKHQAQSQILVPMDAPGIEIVRMLPVFGYDDAPHGHAEVVLKDVRVPVEEGLILGEGRGFEIAQGRLGPGRIHHCMRTIAVAEVA
ncbi:MAG TPA: acyl-CoA dehydrogenase family protein, partial [Caulobacteraceae bacterium]|nr:acyl-CoA dehydrogenase family protein [Caulobacteraceae bacterium]